MSRYSVYGLSLLATSVVAAGVNLWARKAFPAQWGGPNIGGGLLMILFAIGAICGIVLIVKGVIDRKRN